MALSNLCTDRRMTEGLILIDPVNCYEVDINFFLEQWSGLDHLLKLFTDRYSRSNFEVKVVRNGF